jgi:hypothetical protein
VLAALAGVWLLVAGLGVLLFATIIVLAYLGFGPYAQDAASSDSWAFRSRSF